MPTNPVLYPAQVGTSRVLWLLTIQYAGHTIRLSDDTVQVDTEDGQVLAYADGLSPISVTEELTLGGDSGGTLEVPIECSFPEDVDVAQLSAEGHDLSTARGELARWIEGTLWEERRIVLVGRLDAPEYGAGDESIAFSLTEALFRDVTMCSPPGLRMVGANWEHADTVPAQWLGKAYPIVIGKPGFVSTRITSAEVMTGCGAVWCDYRNSSTSSGDRSEIRAIIAGHHVGVTEVQACSLAEPTMYRIRVYNGWDDQGHPIAAMAWFTSNGGSGPAPEGSYDTAFEPYDYADGTGLHGLGDQALPQSFNTTDGAVQLFFAVHDVNDAALGGLTVGGKLVRKAHDVATWLLGRTARPVDRGRMEALEPVLGRFLIDSAITNATACEVWTYFRDNLMPLLPVSLASGPLGLYWIPWRFDARVSDVTVRLDADADPDVQRVSKIFSDERERFTRIIVRYAYSFAAKTYQGEIVLGHAGDVDAAGKPTNFRVNAYMQAAYDALGEIREKLVETWDVYDDGTASAIAEWMAAAYGTPARTVVYEVPEADYIHVTRGAVASLTDSAVAFDGKLAIVTSITTPGTGVLQLGFRLLDRPGQRNVARP